jgi:SAM-dependent methyltransferase/predicted DNA-binding transcriptional regulator AlpA
MVVSLSDDALVSLADVATMAGVSRPAASNWRRRYTDFPTPVQESGTTTLFRFGEIRTWMQRHDKRLVHRSADQAVWAALNPARGSLLPEDAALAGMALLGYAKAGTLLGDSEAEALRAFAVAQPPTLRESLYDLAGRVEHAGLPHIPAHAFDDRMPWTGEAETFLQDVARLAIELGAPEVFEALLTARARGFKGAGEFSTPTSIARLLTALAPPRGTVLDPACGLGTMLLTAATAAPAGEDIDLVGLDHIESIGRLAQVRMLVHDIDADITIGDTFHDAWRGPRADVVLVDPPLAGQWQHDRAAPELLPFGWPPKGRADLAWIQYAISVLRPGGRALVVTGMGPLFRGGIEMDIRRRLVAAGLVQAVVALPAGLLYASGIRPVVWVLADAGGDPVKEVVFVNAAGVGTRRRGRTELSRADIAQIVAAVRCEPNVGSIPSAVVPVSLLCVGDCDLTPERWMEPTSAQAKLPDRIAQASQNLRAAAAVLVQSPQLSLPSASAASIVPTCSLDSMADRGLVALVRPHKVDAADLGHGELPVVRPEDIASDFSATHGALADRMNVPADAELTQPGDVLVLTEGKIRAGVDKRGGAAVIGAIQVVRPLSQSISADVLAALVSMRGQQQAVGTTVRRIKLRSLEVPLLDAGATQGLHSALRLLGEQRRQAAAALNAVDDLTEALVLGASTGFTWPARGDDNAVERP